MHLFSIRQPLMNLKEMKQKNFGKPNCGPKLPIVNYSKAVIKSVLYGFSGGRSINFWTGHTE